MQLNDKQETTAYENGHANTSITNGVDDEEDIESEVDDDKDAVDIDKHNDGKSTRLAIACDDGCVRIYGVSGAEELAHNKTLPRVSGETSALQSCTNLV